MDATASLNAALAGRYTIDREIGRGGMATVYLARDQRHDRRVAVKVLDPELGAVLGAERFLSEIRVTANLQHPNLLPLFDSGEAGGLLFYVMPFVEGETLRHRLDRERQLPVDDAVRIAAGIASALDYAHRHGVIHRDLKPENVLLHDGEPLVADFGIALAVSNAGGQRVTQTGLSLGTPQYMSPEQATGDRAIDGRTDIYSLGAVTYEMLTGEPPHTGNSAQAVIARLMTEEPRSISAVRKSVPAHVEAAVERALQKLPADRFASARQFAEALTDPASGVESGRSRASATRAAAASLRTPLVASALAIFALATIISTAAWWRASHRAPPESPVIRMTLDLPPGDRVLTLGGHALTVSPAGDRIAYVVAGGAGIRTFVRRTSDLAARQIAAMPMQDLTFSPDGRWLAFIDGGEIRKMPADSGAVTTVGGFPRDVAERLANQTFGLSWSPSNTIVVGTDAGVWGIPATGGSAHRISAPDSTVNQASAPLALPDGNTVVYARNLSGSTAFGVTTIDGSYTGKLAVSGIRPVAFLHGYLIYQSSALDLFAVAFDLRKHRTSGEPVQVDGGVGGVGISSSGTMAYQPTSAVNNSVLAGGAQAEMPVIPGARRYLSPRYSPDGRRIAVGVGDLTSGDIWVYDVPTNTFTRLTTRGANAYPEWSPDGKRILYVSNDGRNRKLVWQAADGSAPSRVLFELNEGINEGVISPDGRWLIYRTGPNTQHPRDIFAVPLSGDSAGHSPIPIATGPAAEEMPRVSPDGKWIAYQSDESGRFEIYVRPFPGPGSRVQVSDSGGVAPLWTKIGNEIVYRAGSAIVAAAVTAAPAFSVGKRRTLISGTYVDNPTHPNYDIAPDGRYLVLKQLGGESRAIIVHNWDRELREKLGIR